MKKTLSKALIDLQWKWFLLVLLAGLLLIPIGCGLAVYLIEQEHLSLKDIILISISYTLGISVYSIQSIELKSYSEYTVLFTNFLSYIWLALSTAFLVARIGDNKKRPRLSENCSIYFHDGSGHADKRPGRYLLEFRLVVYPNPEIYKPEIAVTMYLSTPRGRDQIPLELTPVQANKVSAYLTFRAILPRNCLKLSNREDDDIMSILPKTSVDVSVSMIDSASDGKIFLYKNYKVPSDVLSGSFKDAVELDSHGQIKSVISKYLDVIESGE